MPVLLLSLLGGVGSIGKTILAWLSRRSLGEIVCLALGLALLIDHAALLMTHRHEAKVEKQDAALKLKLENQVTTLKSELDAISTAKNQQRLITQEKIVTVTKKIHDADTQAKIVEQTPPAPGCHTTSAVMNADV